MVSALDVTIRYSQTFRNDVTLHLRQNNKITLKNNSLDLGNVVHKQACGTTKETTVFCILYL